MLSNAHTNLGAFRLLTSREAQLVLLASEGLTDKEIAKELGISLGTVITLWSKARAKLGINSRISAVAVMISAIARVASRFGFAEGEPVAHTAVTHLSGTRVLLNGRQVVLACSIEAERLLEIRTGTSLLDHAQLALPLRDPEGTIVSKEDWPWSEALQIERDIEGVCVSAGRGSLYTLDCRSLHDPILGKVVMLEFRLKPKENEDTPRLVWTNPDGRHAVARAS